MPRRTVPEPDVKPYTDEQLRRIALKHKAMHGKLPYPDPIPAPAIKRHDPSTFDLLWANRWNMARHFIIGGSGAALATFTATKDVTASGAAFIVGGVTGVARKGFDDLRRVKGKPDVLTTGLNFVTRTRGVDMSASDYTKAEVVAFGQDIGRLINGARDGVSADDLGALIAAVTSGAKTVNEMTDVPAAAALHTIGAASDVVGDQFLADAIASEVV